MAFDGLQLVWTTQNSWQPHDPRGDWLALHRLYKQLAQDGNYFEWSAALPDSVPRATPANDAVILSQAEQREVEGYLAELVGVDGDRIASDLPMRCCAVDAAAVHLLFAPAPALNSQIVGRLKSKTASGLLRSHERRGQKHIWSSGYWLANLNGAEAIAKVEQFIRGQCGHWNLSASIQGVAPDCSSPRSCFASASGEV